MPFHKTQVILTWIHEQDMSSVHANALHIHQISIEKWLN